MYEAISPCMISSWYGPHDLKVYILPHVVFCWMVHQEFKFFVSLILVEEWNSWSLFCWFVLCIARRIYSVFEWINHVYIIFMMCNPIKAWLIRNLFLSGNRYMISLTRTVYWLSEDLNNWSCGVKQISRPFNLTLVGYWWY